jgi:hypothetical protein
MILVLNEPRDRESRRCGGLRRALASIQNGATKRINREQIRQFFQLFLGSFVFDSRPTVAVGWKLSFGL